MSNGNNIIVYNSTDSNFVTSISSDFVSVDGSEVVIKRKFDGNYRINYNFSYDSTRLNTFSYILYINDAKGNVYTSGIGTEVVTRNISSKNISYVLERFTGEELTISLGVKMYTGTMQIYSTDPSMIISIQEVS